MNIKKRFSRFLIPLSESNYGQFIGNYAYYCWQERAWLSSEVAVILLRIKAAPVLVPFMTLSRRISSDRVSRVSPHFSAELLRRLNLCRFPSPYQVEAIHKKYNKFKVPFFGIIRLRSA